MPKSNRDWWADKLSANVVRDRRTDAALQERGWTVVRIWEHEDPNQAADRIAAVLRARTPPP
jgi:DNA mismatch endonuclease (patch repair protein)